jgi:purine-nucleoside phosphorylase
LQEAADYVLKRLGVDKIDLSIVEGSGLLDLSDHLFRDAGDSVKIISLHDVPHSPVPTAIGHKQELLYAVMQGRRTIIWNGRIHYYEGYRVTHQAFPAYLSAYMGCSVFITTNAAGFINQKMAIGDLALITDHISMINKSYDGVVTFDEQLFNGHGLLSTSQIYDKQMVDLTREAFVESGVKLTEGPYCYFALPNYESPAEIQIMHGLGAATVGASTLPE